MKQTGFTLIEVVIVTIIIGVLAAMVVPRFASAQTDTRVASTNEDIKALIASLENFYSEKGYWPSDVEPGTMPPELASYYVKGANPFHKKCPINGYYSYSNDAITKVITINIIPGSNTPAITVLDAQALDAVLDDGVLNTGRFRATISGYAYRIK